MKVRYRRACLAPQLLDPQQAQATLQLWPLVERPGCVMLLSLAFICSCCAPCALPLAPRPCLAVANFCTGDVCSLPNEQALVTQRGLPLTTCQALCLSADAGGLSAAGTKLVSPPYQINNGLSEEPLNTKVRARQPRQLPDAAIVACCVRWSPDCEQLAGVLVRVRRRCVRQEALHYSRRGP